MIYNPIIIAGATAWALAQTSKVVINMIQGKGFIPGRIIGSGGMPSAHSATICAASASTFKVCGAGSPEFALSVIMAIIVIYDALNVRYQSGLHAAELNKLRKEYRLYNKDENNSGKDFKELLGHTPSEVVVGIALGALVGVFIPVKI